MTLFGDSYDSLGNRQLAYDAARDSRLFGTLAANRANRQLDFGEQAAMADNAYRANALQAQLAEAAQRRHDQLRLNAEAKKDSDLWRYLQLLQQNRAFDYRIGQDELARQDSARDAKENQARYNWQKALSLVDAGLPPAALSSMGLSPEDMGTLTATRKNLAAQEAQQDVNSEAEATNLNARRMALRLAETGKDITKDVTKDYGDRWSFGSLPPYSWVTKPLRSTLDARRDAEIAAKIAALGTIGNPVNPLSEEANAKLLMLKSHNVSFDPDTGEFSPVRSMRKYTDVAPPPLLPPGKGAFQNGKLYKFDGAKYVEVP